MQQQYSEQYVKLVACHSRFKDEDCFRPLTGPTCWELAQRYLRCKPCLNGIQDYEK